MNKGFTLIEILVVVLIIGILASIAWPQYEKAVEHSRASQAFTMLKALVPAYKVYFEANSDYPSKFEEIDATIPADWTGKVKWHNSATDTFSNGEWSLQMYHSSTAAGMFMGRISGPYKGAGFIFMGKSSVGDVVNEIVCAERKTTGIVFEKEAGSFCQDMFSGKLRYTGTMREYSMP